MSGRLTGFRRRLAKVEKALAETAEQEKMANCICRLGPKSRPTIAISEEPEEFEAEMNQKCPVHGFRDLGNIIHIKVTDLHDERFRLDDLLDEYYTRRAEYKRAKLEHDNQEV